jgi:hypothetical protein
MFAPDSCTNLTPSSSSYTLSGDALFIKPLDWLFIQLSSFSLFLGRVRPSNSVSLDMTAEASALPTRHIDRRAVDEIRIA